jgi:hypothetical protein
VQLLTQHHPSPRQQASTTVSFLFLPNSWFMLLLAANYYVVRAYSQIPVLLSGDIEAQGSLRFLIQAAGLKHSSSNPPSGCCLGSNEQQSGAHSTVSLLVVLRPLQFSVRFSFYSCSACRVLGLWHTSGLTTWPWQCPCSCSTCVRPEQLQPSMQKQNARAVANLLVDLATALLLLLLPCACRLCRADGAAG